MSFDPKKDLSRQQYIQVLKILRESSRATEIHGDFNSIHEAYAVILEEVDEFWDEVKKNRHDPGAMKSELTQIAAMCLQTIEFLDKKEKTDASASVSK